MVVQSVHDPDLGSLGQVDRGGIDLPQIVGDLALEALPGLRSLPCR
jgi:hypothetical protein